MRRREVIALLPGVATWPAAAKAWAQSKKPPVSGFLGASSAGTAASHLLPAFRGGLEELGFVEGENVLVKYVWADSVYDRLPALAAELVRRRVDVIVAAGGSIAALVAKAATSSIPIIALAGDDPVRLGLAASINRPGGNVTGIVQLVVASEGKRLEILRELVPDAKVVAFLANPGRPNSQRQIQEMQAAAQALGLELLVVQADDDDELAQALSVARAGAAAVVVGADPYFFARHEHIVALAERHALLAMYFFREFVIAGGLVSYGSSLADAYRQVGVYTAKILKGADPAQLPMWQQSEKLELVINARTARALGLTRTAAIRVRSGREPSCRRARSAVSRPSSAGRHSDAARPEQSPTALSAFLSGLSELGYTDGRNIVLEFRLAAELRQFAGRCHCGGRWKRRRARRARSRSSCLRPCSVAPKR